MAIEGDGVLPQGRGSQRVLLRFPVLPPLNRRQRCGVGCTYPELIRVCSVYLLGHTVWGGMCVGGDLLHGLQGWLWSLGGP